MKTLDHKAALELRFDSDAGNDITLREYFLRLLQTLWHQEEGFSGKRPFGNSGWQNEVYTVLAKAGYVDGDGEGYVARGPDRAHANGTIMELIRFAIRGDLTHEN